MAVRRTSSARPHRGQAPNATSPPRWRCSAAAALGRSYWLLELLGALGPTDSSSKRQTVNKAVDRRLPELLELERRLASLPEATAQHYRAEADRELPPSDDAAHIGDGDGYDSYDDVPTGRPDWFDACLY